MPTCAVRKGFFLLRECNQLTTHLCPRCGRPACDEHTVQLDDGKVCTECLAKTEPTQDSTASPMGSSRGWAHRYRDSYYSRSHYTPMYTGTAAGAAMGATAADGYDDFDRRAFDQDAAVPLEADDDAPGSLFDS
jgi:hypothetical protein